MYLGPSAGVLSTGSDNVFVGFSAGNGGVLGNEGVALGSKAGRSNTANGNHFVGFQAGYSNTDKDKQHFEGYQAGYSNTSGSANHFAGYQAGYGNTSGSENVYVGGEAGAGAGTGGANTALGYRAAHSLVSGSSNTMLGFWAGRLTTSGTQNLFAGAGSGFSNQSGSQNVYLGPSAGVLSTGSDNVFVGFSAGNSNATGTHNTLVGSEAKLTTNGLTNAAAFGYKAEASQSNSLVLGGTGPDAVNVGIGTTAPGATLDVRRGTAISGTAAFSGTDRTSHFSYATVEDTYIRGGKATANVLLNDNGGRVGIRTPAPNSGLQVASSLSVPFRAVYQTAGAYVNVTLSDDDHTVRSGSPTGVVGGARFSFMLPAPGGSPGRTYVLLNYGDTPANLYAVSGANPSGLNLIYDDATSAYLTEIPANARLTLQSDGGTWLVLAR